MMVMVRVILVVRIMNMQHLRETGTPELSCKRCCIPPAHRRMHVTDDIKKRCRWNFDKLNALLLIFMILVIDVTQVLLMSKLCCCYGKGMNWCGLTHCCGEGVIGICQPCTRATPLIGVGGGGSAPDSNPTPNRAQDPCPIIIQNMRFKR